ncbi:MAG: dehydrogenase [Firmicutes bacterium]|nr:dehydrogenase [Bacillota bacterium]
MKALFDKTRLGSICLKNRLFRAATFENRGSKDLVDEMFMVYQNLARGGVGTIITGFTDVLGLEVYEESFLSQYKKITSMVHEYDTKIVLQIGYRGSFMFKDEHVIWGPSAVQNVRTKIKPKEMTQEDIQLMQKAFGDAAQRAKEAGFDGIELQGTHSCLLGQFVSPYYNRRNDEYGGSIENRAKMIFETYNTVRKKVGYEYPVLIKLSCMEDARRGITFQDCSYLCGKLSQLGIDAIEISCDWYPQSIKDNWFKEHVAEIAAHNKVPIILAGGNREFAAMTETLTKTSIEYFSLARPLIAEPDLIQRWEQGNRNKAKCSSCNACLNFDGAFFCILNTSQC